MPDTFQSQTLKILKRTFNVRGWLDWLRLKAITRDVLMIIKRFLVPQPVTVVETFESVQVRMNLSDADLVARQKALYLLSIWMLVIAFFVFVYANYNLYTGRYLAFLLCLAVIVVALALAFRYNFWSFQIRRRKLGCSFKEWVRFTILGEKDE